MCLVGEPVTVLNVRKPLQIVILCKILTFLNSKINLSLLKILKT